MARSRNLHIEARFSKPCHTLHVRHPFTHPWLSTGGIAPGSAQPARSAQLRPASPLASRPRLRDSAPRAKRAHRSGPAQRSPIRGLGPQTQPTRMRHRLNGFLVPPTPPHGVRQRGQVTTTPTGPLAAPQLASLASRVMACAPLAGTNVGFKLRGLQYVVSGDRPPRRRLHHEARTSPRERSSRPGLIHRAFETSDQVGGGSPPTHPRCSPAGDENGVRPPWAAHHYLQDSGLCGRGASSGLLADQTEAATLAALTVKQQAK